MEEEDTQPFTWYKLEDKEPPPVRKKLLAVFDGTIHETIYDPVGIYGSPLWRDPNTYYSYIVPTHWAYMPNKPRGVR